MSDTVRLDAYLHPDVLVRLLTRLSQGRLVPPTDRDHAAWVRFFREAEDLRLYPAKKLGVYSATWSTCYRVRHVTFAYEGGPSRHRWDEIPGTRLRLPYPRMDAPGMATMAALTAWRLEHEAPLLDTSVDMVISLAGL